MKKILTLLLALTLVFALFSCDNGKEKDDDDEVCEEHVDKNGDGICDECKENIPVKVMSYEEYLSADIESEVVIESYVQATQSWWDNKITVYLQDEVGAYFAYEMACSEADAAKLVPGTKIRVTGYKGEWAGEVEITDAKFEILEGSYIATPKDVTALLGTDDLIKEQNKLVFFKGMTVKEISFKNGEPGDDIYVTLINSGKDYSFCVERYLTGPETEVYKAVSALKAGDKIDVEGFLYWYEGMNPHITKVVKGAMSYSEYAAADIDDLVIIDAYVQATQDWWDNKITVYLQDEVGAYFAYEMECSEADAAKLVPGTKIRVTGYKGEWAGEVEIMDATFDILAGSYVAEALDVTALLGTDELIAKQNMFVLFKEMTVKGISFKNGEPGDDIYVTLTKGGADYDFCVERYLTGPDSEVYKAVSALVAGDVIDVEGFLYWYEDVNTHITSITKK